MNELLKFLIAELSFIYDDYGSRFVDSRRDRSSAFVTLETRERIRVRLTLDRGEMLLHFQPAHVDRPDRWISFGSLLELTTGDALESEVLTSDLCRLAKNFFADILDALSPGKLKQSERTLHELAKARTKRAFG